MSSSAHPPHGAARSRKPAPCRLYAQGHCRFGDKCWFSHDPDTKSSGKDVYSGQPPRDGTNIHAAMASDTAAPSPQPTPSDARPRPKRGEIPCRAWKVGTCTKGSKCWFNHDIDTPQVHKPGSNAQKRATSSCPVPESPAEDVRPSASPGAPRVEHDNSNVQGAEHVQAAQEAEAVTTPTASASVAAAAAAHVAAARERADAIAREEAAKTITQVVSGALVTYSAGFDVPNLITGFDTCTLHVGNLPSDVREDDVRALLRAQGVQGIDITHVHLVIRKKPDRRPEAHVVTDVASGRTLALALDGVEFQEETLVVDVSATNAALEGMSAASGQSAEILTISWRAPSVRYVAEYADVAAAKSKVKELDRLVHAGRRIKVEMNSQPRGRVVANLRLNAIKINNLPLSVTDDDVIKFSGSTSVKRLPVGGLFGTVYTVEEIARQVRDDVQRAVPGGLRKFDDPPSSTCTMDGIVFARAHFPSWDEAHAAYTRLSGRRYGNQPVWLRLPDPMYFTLVIPAEQYKAQKGQWDSLLNSIKDRRACTLNVRDFGNMVRIQLSGSVKEATGALKVRVENLARGDKMEGWHRSLGISGNSFVRRVYSETCAYLRADWKRQSLKVYGSPRAVDHAREMIKAELDRLASLDYTVTIARRSVGFFVRDGIQQLKDTLGEDNVRFATSTRKITVSGGEEAHHALDRLITLSYKGDDGLPSTSQGSQTCPVCYDTVSSPHQLGCGHAYCVACLRHFISSALDSDQLPLICIGDEARCRVLIAIPTIQQFLPPASFNRLLEAAFDAYIAKHPEEFKHCKTPDCTQIYRAVQTGAEPKTLHCPSCFSAVCNGCHEDAHEGLSCVESKARRDPREQERLNDAWIASQGGRVKKCPRCSVPIEKLQGCNHMTCRCGAHICWRCMGVFTAETIYDHMNAAHGTIHDDLPAVLVPEPPVNIGIPVDIGEQRELWRQAEARRVAAAAATAVRNANEAGPNLWRHRQAAVDFYANVAQGARERMREEAERMERFVRAERAREVEERERRQRWLREAEARRRAEQERERGGWCAIM